MTRLRCGSTSFEWLEDWASPPVDELRGAGWAHHDVVVTADGNVMAFQSGGDAVAVFDHHGHLLDTWSTGLVEAHGMTLTGRLGQERLWIADPGTKMLPEGEGEYGERSQGAHGSVVVFDLTGRRLRALPTPDIPEYATQRFCPTAIAIDDRTDGDHSIWVADGYGESLVHRLSADGQVELTLTGDEGAGRFECPHSLLIDHRGPFPRLYITDRGNDRLQVYDLDGGFLHVVSEGLRLPSGLAVFDEQMFVAELTARVAVLDFHDQVACYLGADDEAPRRDGWPNAAAADGRTVRPADLLPGRFNSPHGIAVDPRGDLYVTEWLIGGRLTRLHRAD